MKELIHIYYTNDLHSNFSYWPKVATYVKEERAKRRLEQKTTLLVDVGDHIDRVNHIAEAFKGQGNVALLNALQYDFITLGNNEGITFSRIDLYQLYEQANFSVVCSNLRSQLNEQPGWLSHTELVTTKLGVKIGILGLTVPYDTFYHLLGWDVESPYDALEKYIDHMRRSADIIVLLSHLGISEDRRIAELFPQIDVIIGGHTHHLLRTGEYVNETLITAAGKYCSHVGEVILTWDHAKKTLSQREAYVMKVTHLEDDPETVGQLSQLNKAANQELTKPIVKIDKQLMVSWYEETEIMQFLTDTLTAFTKADCGLLNAGLLLDHFPKGMITYKDVHRICPHPINPAVVYLRGDELIEVIRATLTEQFMQFKLKGLGFRGKVLGRMVFSNIDVQTKTLADGKLTVESIKYKGEDLIPNHLYKVATADTFTFGRLLPEIAKANKKRYFLPETIRDLLVRTLKLYY